MYKQQILIKGKSYEKRFMLAMALVLLLISIGGCWVLWDEGGRDGEHDRGGSHGSSKDSEGHRDPESGGHGGGGPGGGGPGGGH